MTYGKIIDGKIKYLSDKTKRFTDTENNLVVVNPKEAEFERAGYIPLVTSDKPTDSEYYYSSWQIVDGEIACVWTAYEPDLEV